MPNSSDVKWFKGEFGAEIGRAVAGTPFDLDMLTALACQETGYIWSRLRRLGLDRKEILRLCVGDTLDRTKTFPRNRRHLKERDPAGEMFAYARAALVDLGKYDADYGRVAAANPDKFCKGFGIFQYDMQFFGPETKSYFMGGYADFGVSLARCVGELKEAMKRAKVPSTAPLTDMQKAAVVIAYNSGSYNPALGLKQGFKPKNGPYYGEAYYAFLQLSRSVIASVAHPAPTTPLNNAILPPVTPMTVAKPYVVATNGGLLNVRSSPKKIATPSNIIRGLPTGHPVSVISAKPTNGFAEIETNIQGAHIQGWASLEYLKPAAATAVAEELAEQIEPPGSTVPAVYLPVKTGTIVRRTAPATAGSLNEGGQPQRQGNKPEDLVASIADIITWLAVEKATHKRYQPRDGLTFCNIYAHDFCFLAGIYLPRVWWSSRALVRIAAGETVEPRYAATIDELRANDLFRWLRDFGSGFGWRQTGTLTKLQLAANSGGVGLIVARRKEEGKSGHIVVVVPETETERASWGPDGAVSAPLQSQAGATNFRRGTGRKDWWLDDKFAEFALWIHA